MTTARTLTEAFCNLYGGQPKIYRAPGRVNLIGEHTDYNQGFVMPAAIDFSTWVAVAPRRDRKLTVRSENFAETAEFDLDETTAHGKGHWSDYPFGVAKMLEQGGLKLNGATMLVRGEVPLGSGLSSSAAIEVATGLALLDNSEAELDRLELARVCQQAENEFVGMRCGLMDQFISCFGEARHALMLDCRSLEAQQLALPDEVKLVVCNTMVKHELATSEYNARRAECEEGVRLLGRKILKLRSLRDLTLNDLDRFRSELSDVVYRRCRHVVSENHRVIEAAAALRCGDLPLFGKLMAASHQSLRDDYEVSCEELDTMVDLAKEVKGTYGARMTGGGFGGCTINLVKMDCVDQFKQSVARGYAAATGREPEIYVCSATQGAERVE